MRREIFKIVLVIFLLIVYLLVGNHFNIYLFCPIKKFLGLYCPGCGVTRMLYSILKGQFYQAFRYNPLIFISLPFCKTTNSYGMSTKCSSKTHPLPHWTFCHQVWHQRRNIWWWLPYEKLSEAQAITEIQRWGLRAHATDKWHGQPARSTTLWTR